MNQSKLPKWHWKQDIKYKRLSDEFIARECDKSEYDKLKKFHYIATKRPVVLRIFGLYHKTSNILYGIVIYSPPVLEILARNRTKLGSLLKLYKNKSMRYHVLNKLAICRSRVVIHPSVRSIGASAVLLATWKELPYPFVETLSIMHYYRNFLTKDYTNFIKVIIGKSATNFYSEFTTKPYQHRNHNITRRTKSPFTRYGYALYENAGIDPLARIRNG